MSYAVRFVGSQLSKATHTLKMLIGPNADDQTSMGSFVTCQTKLAEQGNQVGLCKVANDCLDLTNCSFGLHWLHPVWLCPLHMSHIV